MLYEERDDFFSGIMSTKNHVLQELLEAILPGNLTANRKNKRQTKLKNGNMTANRKKKKRQAKLRNGNRVLLIVIHLLYN